MGEEYYDDAFGPFMYLVILIVLCVFFGLWIYDRKTDADPNAPASPPASSSVH
jgi:cytochrome c biogenesis factor